MVSRAGASGILIGAAIGTLLVPAHGSAQDSLSVSCADVDFLSPLEDLTRCAGEGTADTQVTLGLRYYQLGGPEDLTEALRWFRLAADQGDATGQYALGLMYANGDGVREDDAEAVRWYRLAAAQGLAEAQSGLGFMYANGDGVPEDDAEAVRWFRLAAEQGLAEAQSGLGFHYAMGQGVPEDLVYAYMWFNLAAAQADERAQEGKDALVDAVDAMTREQIAEAQRLSREWIETHPQDGGN